jgi:hypothetical protein
MAHTSLLASNRDSLAYPCQIFECECLTLRACLRYQRLADAMVGVFLKAVFTPSILAQSPARSAGVCQLQSSAMLIAAFSNALNVCTAVGFAIRVSRQIDDAEIDAQVATWLIALRRGLRLGDA